MKKLFALALATCFTLGTAFAQEQEEAQDKQPKQQKQERKAARKQGKQRMDPAKRRDIIIARQTERLNKAAEEILQAYDKNKDGKLGDDEIQAMDQAFRAAQKTIALNRQFKLFKNLDENQDFTLTQEEVKAKFDQMPQFNRAMRPGRPGKPGKPGRQGQNAPQK